MVVFRMTLEMKKRKHMKAKLRLKLWKVCGREELPAVWDCTAVVLKETAKKVFGESKEEDKETRWWNKEAENIQRTRASEKHWVVREYCEDRHTAKRGKGKGK